MFISDIQFSWKGYVHVIVDKLNWDFTYSRLSADIVSQCHLSATCMCSSHSLYEKLGNRPNPSPNCIKLQHMFVLYSMRASQLSQSCFIWSDSILTEFFMCTAAATKPGLVNKHAYST